LEQTQKEKEVLEAQLKQELLKIEENEKKINELKEAAKNIENASGIQKVKQQLKKKYEKKYNELEEKQRQTLNELETMKDQALDLRQKLKLLQFEKGSEIHSFKFVFNISSKKFNYNIVELAEKRLEELQQTHNTLKEKLNKDITNLENLLRAERTRNITAETIQKVSLSSNFNFKGTDPFS
jgi:chromosome segregation ATPase